MRPAVSVHIPSPWTGPSRRVLRLWPPSLVAVGIVAAGCSATPLQAEPNHAADAASVRGAQVAPLSTSGVRDPLDALRERLADKLNVSKTREVTGVDALRVSSHAGVDERLAAPQKGAASSPARRVSASRRASPPPLTLAAAARAGALLPRTATAADVSRGNSPMLPLDWNYDGDAGPQRWGRLRPEFAACGAGNRQSPIDIRDGIKVQLDAVQFDYRPSAFSVVDNGHTVQVNVAPGNSIQAMGRRYDLVSFDFHRPAEERVNGRPFDMAVHLTHRDLDGHLAVVAVLLDRGSAHPLVQTVWNNLPLEKHDEVRAQSLLDLQALLPTVRSYYTYMGSLTTPPCSEGVLWMVMKNPVTISDEQLAIFARLYPMNARPIQAVAGRLIKESN